MQKKEQRNEDRKDVRPILIRSFQNQTTTCQNEDHSLTTLPRGQIWQKWIKENSQNFFENFDELYIYIFNPYRWIF